MGIAPDTGGRVGLGRPLVPDVFEQQTSAQTSVAKEGLGLVQNTLDMTFAELGRNVWKYSSSPSKPSIPLFVFQEVVHSERKESSKLEQQRLKQLFEDMPLSIKEKLREDAEKPAEERDPFWAVVEQVLKFGAKALTWIEEIEAQPRDAFTENTFRHSLIVDFALKNWLDMAKEMQAHTTYLPNEPLSKAIIFSETLLNGQAAAAFQLLPDLKELHALCQQKKLPGIPGITSQLLDQLISLATAKSHQALSPYLFALDLVFRKDTIFGSFHTSIFKYLGQSAYEQPVLQKSIENFSKLLVVSFAAAVLEASGLENGAYSIEMQPKIDSTSGWALQLSSCLIASSDFYFELLKEITRQLGPAPAWFCPAVSVILMQELILAGARGNKRIQSAAPLLRGMRHALEEKLAFIKHLEFEMADFATLLTQAYLAIKKGSSAGYLQAFENGLTLLEINKLDLLTETDQPIDSTREFLRACHQVSREQGISTIISQAA